MDAITRSVVGRYSQIAVTRSAAAAASSGKVSTESSSDAATAERTGTSTPKVDTVETSGRALMISRLFSAVPETTYSTPGDSASSGVVYSYLTREDRDAISGLYEVARDNGTDLRQVDAIAFDLGVYRSTRREIVHASPVRYEADGTPRPAAFSDQDEAAAQRMLTSKALTTSALPADFLRTRLDPAMSEGHATDLSVLEQLVYATSPNGDARDPDAVVPPRPRDYFTDALAQLATSISPEATTATGTAEPSSRSITAAELLRAVENKDLDSLYAFITQWYNNTHSR